jgi:hypothetical protein
MPKLKMLQRKAFEQILGLIKVIPKDKMPPQVTDELAKHGIVWEEGETGSDFAEKIKKYCKEVEKTL